MRNLRFPVLNEILAESEVQDQDEAGKAEAAGTKKTMVDPTPFLEPFEKDDVTDFLEEYNLVDDIEDVPGSGDDDESPGAMVKLKQEVAQDLADTKELFLSQRTADERMEGFEDQVRRLVEEVRKEVAPDFQFDEVQVTQREEDIGNPTMWYEVTLIKGDEEKELQILTYSYEPWLHVQEMAESNNWAAWLGVEDSPFFDSSFCDAYDYDFATIALDQFVHTFDESQDLWDMKDAIKEMAESYVPTFEFYVNKDERGEFAADVRNEKGETVFEFASNADGEIEMVEDGYMRHSTDLAGLEKYLIQHEIMPKGSQLVKGN